MGSRMMVKGAALRGNMPMYKYAGNKVLTWMENRLAGLKLSELLGETVIVVVAPVASAGMASKAAAVPISRYRLISTPS